MKIHFWNKFWLRFTSDAWSAVSTFFNVFVSGQEEAWSASADIIKMCVIENNFLRLLTVFLSYMARNLFHYWRNGFVSGYLYSVDYAYTITFWHCKANSVHFRADNGSKPNSYFFFLLYFLRHPLLLVWGHPHFTSNTVIQL